MPVPMVHSHINPGRILSLLPSEEIALKRVWAILLKWFGYHIHLSNDDIKWGGLVSSFKRTSNSTSPALTGSAHKFVDSEGLSIVLQNSCSNIKSCYYLLETGRYADDDEVFSLYHQEPHPLLAEYIPEDLHRSLWEMARNDNIDSIVLRFLRYSDFDVKASLKSLAASLDWRVNKFCIDDLLNKGDAHVFFEGKQPQLVNIMRNNEVYFRGRLRSGCPVLHIRTKDHIRSNCPDEDYDQYIALMFEWGRLKCQDYKSGRDRVHAIFDLTGFTLKNADFRAIKFAVKAFQRWYPDAVEVVYLHNAPRVFSLVWNIVVKWMKPRLRDKIVFTRGIDALKKYIDLKHIPKSLGGKDIIPPYVEPTVYNSRRKDPDSMFNNLMKQRDELTVQFIDATVKWIEATTKKESREHLESKINICKARCENYIYLDPYLRSPGILDRNGELGSLSY